MCPFYRNSKLALCLRRGCGRAPYSTHLEERRGNSVRDELQQSQERMLGGFYHKTGAINGVLSWSYRTLNSPFGIFVPFETGTDTEGCSPTVPDLPIIPYIGTCSMQNCRTVEQADFCMKTFPPTLDLGPTSKHTTPKFFGI